MVNPKYIGPPYMSFRHASLVVINTPCDILLTMWQSLWHNVELDNDPNSGIFWPKWLYFWLTICGLLFPSWRVFYLYLDSIQCSCKFQPPSQIISVGMTPILHGKGNKVGEGSTDICTPAQMEPISEHYSSTTVNRTYGQPDTTDIRTWILWDSA